jgi:uncharacterized RDD family membrane protein YckC
MEEGPTSPAQTPVPEPTPQAAPPAEAEREIPAGFWVRAGAAFLDGLALLAALVVVAVAVVLVVHDKDLSVRVIQAASILLGGAYYTVLTAKTGQTLGKMAAGVRVTTQDGAPPSMLRSLGRWAGYSLSSLPLGLGFAMAGWNKRRRGLHDFVAGTRVVYLPGVSKRRKSVMVGLGCLFMVATIAYATLAALGEMEGGPDAAMQDRLGKEGAAIGNLKGLRTLIAEYEGDNKGAKPATLDALKSKDFTAIPTLELPDHAASNAVELYAGAAPNGVVDATKVKDTGHWAFDPQSGTVFIDCSHVDSEGNKWSGY